MDVKLDTDLGTGKTRAGDHIRCLPVATSGETAPGMFGQESVLDHYQVFGY
jgi:hypothetical protein